VSPPPAADVARAAIGGGLRGAKRGLGCAVAGAPNIEAGRAMHGRECIARSQRQPNGGMDGRETQAKAIALPRARFDQAPEIRYVAAMNCPEPRWRPLLCLFSCAARAFSICLKHKHKTQSPRPSQTTQPQLTPSASVVLSPNAPSAPLAAPTHPPTTHRGWF
jgi:hypothetical protein